MNTLKKFISISALFLMTGGLQAATMEDGIQELQQQWAMAKYRMEKDEQDKAFEDLTEKAQQLSNNYPSSAEPQIWQAIIISTHAGVSGGLGALSKVKHARELLEAAEKINAKALKGSVYTSLGSLYYQVPGWPLGFGDDDKAEAYLKKALSMNPDGIDPNYFYGDFLLEEGRYQEAVTYLQKAIDAPARPNRPVADAGRREEARAALQKAKANLTVSEN
jgi:tetratricopeptide (TPR) repeat protein